MISTKYKGEDCDMKWKDSKICKTGIKNLQKKNFKVLKPNTTQTPLILPLPSLNAKLG